MKTVRFDDSKSHPSVRSPRPARGAESLRGLVIAAAPDAFDPLSEAEVAEIEAVPLAASGPTRSP